MHPYLQVAIFEGFQGDRIVEILGILRVDGYRENRPEIPAPANLGFRYDLRKGRSLLFSPR